MSLRILCSNDDGIHAEGLETLEKIARELSDDVWVVAPETDQSGAARSLTISHPLRVRKVGERKFAVSGTPTDCVQMGVGTILHDDGRRPDLILSGVNNGQNVAEDITFSGTVAVAFQGMALGVPSVALSLARFRREHCHWETPEQHAPAILKKLLDKGWDKDVVININFPDRTPEEVTGIELTAQGARDKVNLFAEERTDLRGRRYYWFGFDGTLSDPADGTDLRAIYEGRISITPVHLDLTHERSRQEISKIFD